LTGTPRTELFMAIEQGDFVEVRGRQWLVEAINDARRAAIPRNGPPTMTSF